MLGDIIQQSVKVSVGTIWRDNCTALWWMVQCAHQLQTWCGFTVWFESGWKVFGGRCQKRVDCSIGGTAASSHWAAGLLVPTSHWLPRIRSQDIGWESSITFQINENFAENFWISETQVKDNLFVEIWPARAEDEGKEAYCASASCLPDSDFGLERLQNYISPTPNSISHFFTFHTTLPIKLSVSHFFNCPQATESNLCLWDNSRQRPHKWGRITTFEKVQANAWQGLKPMRSILISTTLVSEMSV